MQRVSLHLPCTEFATPPQRVVAELGQMAQMDCVYNLSKPVTWEDGTSILDFNDGHLTLFSNGTLQFNSVTEEDEGDYSCVALVGNGKTARCTGNLRLGRLAEPGGFTRTNYNNNNNASQVRNHYA